VGKIATQIGPARFAQIVMPISGGPEIGAFAHADAPCQAILPTLRHREEDTMDDTERYARGMSMRRKVLGAAWVDRQTTGKTSFNDEFQSLITRNVWGEVWTRPHFDERTRRILVIGTMMALGTWDEFRLHVRSALTEGGFSPDDIKEIILQQTAYCGAPAGNHAFKEAGEIVKELGKGA
jgi:4-carboxymuconolactone decarboxylase